jgi:3-methyladenine DNA glycosylase AlkD
MNRNPEIDRLVKELQAKANPTNVEGMKRFGIQGGEMLGVSVTDIRKIAHGIRDHELALDLWDTGIHEARIMASIVEDPKRITLKQMDEWVNDFDSWDVCDQVSTILVDSSPLANELIFKWAASEKEFVRRAAFATIAGLAVHNKVMKDEEFEPYLDLIKKYSDDDRNFVKKAVNWALRNIGKRNVRLCKRAIEVATQIDEMDNKSARWIARDALRELNQKLTENRIGKMKDR